ncbi:MAG: ECF transporter S component [Firmicutes bacterium]|nr:ECF transporter S component [Bacillota bacterium]
MRSHLYIKNMILTSLFLAIGLVLPAFFHSIGAGQAFLPMHLPVMVCGLVCGWQWGLLCGAVLPLISSIFLGMPALFPLAISMIFELAAYGFLCGWLLTHYTKRGSGIYLALILAMLGGRLVSGVTRALLFSIIGLPYSWQIFINGAFITAIPGIILQLIIVPPLAIAIKLLPFNQKTSINGGLRNG